MSTRILQQIIPSIATSDGAGVRLRRSIGQTQTVRVDPFLMLDEFSSINADDYIAGFPSHPHRGFETVTYILDGHMLHEDHLGNKGDLKSGGAQWMTAGRGIIHSEMPQQVSGRMRGFQLWVNLPAKDKMQPAGYQDVQAEEIPVFSLANGGEVKVIAGTAKIAEQVIKGPIQGISAEVLMLDVRLPAGGEFAQALPNDHNAFIYGFEGDLLVGPADNQRVLATQSAGVLSTGDLVELKAGTQGAAFLLLVGRPLKEPIVQHGPFVMNTRAEIEQAIDDYNNGRLV